MSAPSKSAQIAGLNDAFRSMLMIPQFEPPKVKGKAVWTQGIEALTAFAKIEIVAEVRNFDGFTKDNDPYGEHDFGALDHPEAGKIFWKIDYFADDTCSEGSSYPEDPDRSYRVLTIMLADEY